MKHGSIEFKLTPSVFSAIFFATSLILSLIFYKERLFADSGLYLFSLTNNESFIIPHFRYSAVLTQLPAWIAVRCGADLTSVARIFSASFVIFYALIFLYSKYVLRSKSSSLLPILLCSASANLFFWPVSELMLSCAFAYLLHACAESEARRSIVISTEIMSIVLAIGSHPVGSIISIYVLTYRLFAKKITSLRFLLPTAICIAGIILRLFFLTDSYETSRLVAGDHFLSEEYAARLGFYLIFCNPVTVCLFAFLAKQKNALARTACVVSATSIAAINVFFPAADYYFYYDNLMLIPLFILLVPASEMTSHINIKKRSILLTLLLGFFLAGIAYVSPLYSSRVATALSFSSRNNAVVSDTIAGMTGNWSFPAESIVLTSLRGKTGNAIPASYLSESERVELNQTDKIMISPGTIVDRSFFNPKYFVFSVDSNRTGTR